MKIGIIGSGHVGVTLAKGLAGLGHDVQLGTNSPDKKADLTKELGKVPVGSFEDVAEFGELAILAIKGSAAEEVITKLAPKLAGKVVIDTTNPIADAAPVDGVILFFTDYTQSLFEKLVAAAPDVKLVKAFNSVGNGVMVSPKFAETPTMFICGADAEAKSQATGLLKELGWDAADMGSPVAARAIEPLCILWCIPGMLENDWNHAYRLLKG